MRMSGKSERGVLPWLTSALFVLVSSTPMTALAEQYGSKRLSFRIGGEVNQLVISLGTSSVADIPLPSLDPQSIEAYRAQVLARAGDTEPNIEIIVPLPEYGFSGTIDNAQISQGRGVSFDPASIHAQGGIRHVGKLAISEFTEDVLRASYSAALYYIGEGNQPALDRNISGTFWISFPILNDPRADEGYPESEDIRLQLAGMWDLLRNLGLGLDDAAEFAASGGPGGGPGSGAGQGSGSATGSAPVPECNCECDVLIALPEDHACIQPDGVCYQGLALCRQFGLDKTSPAADADVEAILDRMVGKDAPQTVRAATRDSVLQMSKEERAKLLEEFRRSEAAIPGRVPALEDQQAFTGAASDAGQVPVNPDWDAETLRYKSAVEQLGLPADIVEDAVEMFHNNAAPMREQLWRNVEAQLAARRGKPE